MTKAENTDQTSSTLGGAEGPASLLKQEYLEQQRLFQAQPPLLQRYLEAQASSMAEAVVKNLAHVHFSLPDRVVYFATEPGGEKTAPVTTEYREQKVGGLRERLSRTDLRTALRQRLLELEQSSNLAVSVGAVLLKYALVVHLVYRMLPAGRTVEYQPEDGDEIPNIPLSGMLEPESAITATTDAIAEEGEKESGRGELLVPFVPAARRFFLPQWVAFDEEGKLLVNNVNEAEAHVASMQRYLEVLHAAVSLAPYIVVDENYLLKRYGMLGQLVNQGRALARYRVHEIIRTIKRRAAGQDLNRGLSLSLPYFDDQHLAIVMYDFEIIPAGRVMFVPAFVVRAAREQQAKVAQDTRLNRSTRRHLLDELGELEATFLPPK